MAMGLNLVKLCVGIDAVESLQASMDFSIADKKSRGIEEVHYHVTRMVPKRVDELLDGGSLYWVIKGKIQVRQHIAEISLSQIVPVFRAARLFLNHASS